MVAHSRTTVRTDRLRPLNTPRPIRVDADPKGAPIRVYVSRQGSGGGAVSAILDQWRIDDEWWRKEISRMYFHVALANGGVITIFHDLIGNAWFLQAVAKAMEQEQPLDVVAPRAVPKPVAVKRALRRAI